MQWRILCKFTRVFSFLSRDKFCLPQFTADPQILSQRLISSLLPKFFLRGRAANSFFRKVFCRNHNKSVKVDAKAYLLALVVRGNFPSLAGPILWCHNVNCFEYLNVSAVAELLPSKDIDIFLPCQFALKFCSGVVYSMIFVPSRFRRPRGTNACLHSLRFHNRVKILFLSASSVLLSAFRRPPMSSCGWHSFHTCVLSVKFLFTIGVPFESLFSCKIFSAALWNSDFSLLFPCLLLSLPFPYYIY